MIELFSNEFWIAISLFFHLFFLVFLFFLVKKINRIKAGSVPDSTQQNTADDAIISTSVNNVIEMLEPLMREARKVALRFDDQIKEKKRLLKDLNEALDNRIIHINLLLSRAEAQQKKLTQHLEHMPRVTSSAPVAPVSQSSEIVFDQQNQILRMVEQQFDAETIADKLSVPRGEVQMVIDLKKKFSEMEQSNR